MATLATKVKPQGLTPEQREAFLRSVLGPFNDVQALEKGIADIAAGMQKLSESRLRRDTIVTLLAHRTKLARRDIEFVLNALGDLERDHLKPVMRVG